MTSNVASQERAVVEALFAHAPLGIVVLDADLNVVFANVGARDLMGSEIVGRNSAALVHSDDLAIIGQTLSDTATPDSVFLPTVVKVLTHRGVRPLEFWIQHVDLNRTDFRWVLSVRDAGAESHFQEHTRLVQDPARFGDAMGSIVSAIECGLVRVCATIVWNWDGSQYRNGVGTHANDHDLRHAAIAHSGQVISVARGQTPHNPAEVFLQGFIRNDVRSVHMYPISHRTASRSSMLIVTSEQYDRFGMGSARFLERARSMIQVALDYRDYTDSLRRVAMTDHLTGVLNRRSWREALQSRSANGLESDVFLVDLDNFKFVNDEYGHGTGDVVLVACARRLSEVLPPDALIGRLGGDEFAVIVPCVPGRDIAEVLRLVTECDHEPLRLTNAGTLNSTAELVQRWSVGVGHLAPGQSPEVALEAADSGMYRTKRSRNTVEGDRRRHCVRS